MVLPSRLAPLPSDQPLAVGARSRFIRMGTTPKFQPPRAQACSLPPEFKPAFCDSLRSRTRSSLAAACVAQCCTCSRCCACWWSSDLWQPLPPTLPHPTAATNGPSNMGSWQLATPAELLPSRLTLHGCRAKRRRRRRARRAVPRPTSKPHFASLSPSDSVRAMAGSANVPSSYPEFLLLPSGGLCVRAVKWDLECCPAQGGGSLERYVTAVLKSGHAQSID